MAVDRAIFMQRMTRSAERIHYVKCEHAIPLCSVLDSIKAVNSELHMKGIVKLYPFTETWELDQEKDLHN